jgi:hypothetical protein
MTATAELNLNLHPKQHVALTTSATEVLYGGAAGGGKSHLMRIAAILWCAMIPGLQVYLFRRIREDLEKNHIEGPKGFRMLLAPWVTARLCVMVEGEIRFWNGSKIWLCHCKDEKDRFKYLGAEIHVLIIDELTTFTEIIYRFLRGRVRAVGLNLPAHLKGMFPRILAGSNPGNIGHHFVKASFIDGVQPFEIRAMNDDEGGMRRQYIPARLDDNPSMTEDDPSYRAKLKGLGSPALVKAMEDGDWNVVVGAYFAEWSTIKHVIEPFAIPPNWLKFGSLDWGSAKPFSMQWWAVSDGSLLPDGRQYPAGALIHYREWYGASAPNVGIKLTAEQLADGIKDREIVRRDDGTKIPERIDYRVADPSCWKVDGGPSIAERMYDNGKGVLFRPADNQRLNGWDQVRGRLVGLDGEPMMYVFSTCTNFIRTVPALQHDQARAEDVDSDSEDHAGDSARYACQSRPWTRKPDVVTPIRGTNEMTINEAWKLAGPKRVKDARI